MAWARDHAEALSGIPVWLFTSGPLGDQTIDPEKAVRQLPELREAVHPRDHRVFFGALDKDELALGERIIMKAVKAPEGDFRDWDAIAAWADEIADALS